MAMTSGTIFLVMAVLAATDTDRLQRWPHRRTLLPLEVNAPMDSKAILVGHIPQLKPAHETTTQVGLTIFLLHVVLVPFTGCSINPARSFGPAVVNNYWRQHWVWWVAPLIGGLLAATLYNVLFFFNDEPKEQVTGGRSAGIFGPFGGPRLGTSG